MANQDRRNKNQDKSAQTYRFRRVLGDILKYLNHTDGEQMFLAAKSDFGHQLHELVTKGYTWGYSHSLPTHQSDFKSLNRKEWAAIRGIVKKYTFKAPDQKKFRV